MAQTPASGGTLVAAQALVGTLFDRTGIVFENSPASDGMGGSTANYVEGSPIACHLQPSKRLATETVEGGAETALDRWAIAIPVGTNISVSDRIQIDSIFYEVIGHDAGKSFGTEIMLDCLRVNDGE